MVRARRIPVLVALASLALATTPGAAVDHDGCNNGVDAGDAWQPASPTSVPRNCNGEMHQVFDHDDWYYNNILPTQAGGAALAATLCPAGTKNGPWNPDLQVYFQVLGMAYNPQAGNFDPNLQGPGVLKGASSNAAGCDTVDAAVAAAELPGLGQWFVHVHRSSGDGFYTLVLT